MKLFFTCPPVTINNNLSLKIYYGYIMDITFLFNVLDMTRKTTNFFTNG